MALSPVHTLPPEKDPRIPFARLTDRLKKILSLGEEEGRGKSHKQIEAEDLLAGVLLEGTGVAANLLKNLGTEPASLIEALRKEFPGEGKAISVTKRLSLSNESVSILKRAEALADEFGYTSVGSELCLLALAAAEGTTVHWILNSKNITADDLKAEIGKLTYDYEPSEAWKYKDREQTSKPPDPALTNFFYPLTDERLRASLHAFHVAYEQFEPPTEIDRHYVSQWSEDRQRWLKTNHPDRYWDSLPRFVKGWLRREVTNAVQEGKEKTVEPWLLTLFRADNMPIGLDGRRK